VFGHGRGVGQQAHVALQPARVLAQLAAHPLDLPHDEPGVVQQRAARGRGLDAPASALQ